MCSGTTTRRVSDLAYVKAQIPSEVYHLTKEKNLDSILSDGKIRRFNDTECWFCENLTKMRAYMEQTVLCEGKPYYAVGGQLCRYPKFIPEDYVILKLMYYDYDCTQPMDWIDVGQNKLTVYVTVDPAK